MKPEQIELARHALGLRAGRSTSFRNHFVAGDDHPDYADWHRMMQQGNAVRRTSSVTGQDWIFHLTRKGAEAALRPGETLCPEDFPARSLETEGA